MIISKFVIEELTSNLIASKHVVARQEEFDTLIPNFYNELNEVLQSQEINITGPLFFIYRDEPKNGLFDIEIGHAVSGKFTGDDEILCKESYQGKVAKCEFKGSYDNIPSAWDEFGVEIKNSNLVTKELCWESYDIGPNESSNPELWVTTLYQSVE
jgi:effector-binding domain-containing protein